MLSSASRLRIAHSRLAILLLSGTAACSGTDPVTSINTGGTPAGSGGFASTPTSVGGAATAQGGGTAADSTGLTQSGGTVTTGGSNPIGGTSNQSDPNSQGGVSATGGATSTGGSGSSTYEPCPTDGSACKIMPFGDSITDGYTVSGGYRVELFRLAHSAGKNITFVGEKTNGPTLVDGVTFPPNHEGFSGWTIEPIGTRKGISTKVATAMSAYTPHIVLLMIGTNDCIDNAEVANAPTRLGRLIDSIYAQLPNVLVVVAQIIPSRENTSVGDQADLTARIQAFNAAIPDIVQARASAGKHIQLVDMYTPFAPNKASLMGDEWHPNATGYALIGTQWYGAISAFLP